MRLELVHTGGRYPERVYARLCSVSSDDVVAYQVPRDLPPVLDEAAEFLPPELGQAEVVIAINIHPELLLEIPRLVGSGNMRALIAPIEDPSWIKPGLQRQVTQACAERGIESAFPKPFCSLRPSTPAVREFCEHFQVGAPTLRIAICPDKVAAVEVLRGSPCGLTDFVVENLIGLPVDDSLPEKAGRLHHSYPCLASMNLDPETGETVMHASLYLLRDQVRQALEAARSKA